MKHVLYAVFPSTDAAAAALADIKDHGLPEDDLSVLMHEPGPVDRRELAVEETDARPAMAKGSILGALAGVLTMTIVATPVGLLGAGPLAVAALGATAGGALGALGAGLSGLSVPDAELQRLLDHLEAGKVLVTVTTSDMAEAEAVEDIFSTRGAQEARKHLL